MRALALAFLVSLPSLALADSPPAAVTVHVGRATVADGAGTHDLRFAALEYRIAEPLVTGVILENPLPADADRAQMSEQLRELLGSGLLPRVDLFLRGRHVKPGLAVCQVDELPRVVVRLPPKRVLDLERIGRRCLNGKPYRPPRKTPKPVVTGTQTARVDARFHTTHEDGSSSDTGPYPYAYVAFFDPASRPTTEILDAGDDGVENPTWTYEWNSDGTLAGRTLDLKRDGTPILEWAFSYDPDGSPILEEFQSSDGTVSAATPLPAPSGPPHIFILLPTSGSSFMPLAVAASNFANPTVPYINGTPSISLFNWSTQNIPLIGSISIGFTIVPPAARSGPGDVRVEYFGQMSNAFPFEKN